MLPFPTEAQSDSVLNNTCQMCPADLRTKMLRLARIYKSHFPPLKMSFNLDYGLGEPTLEVFVTAKVKLKMCVSCGLYHAKVTVSRRPLCPQIPRLTHEDKFSGEENLARSSSVSDLTPLDCT